MKSWRRDMAELIKIDEALCRKLWDEGLSMREMGLHLGISGSTVGEWVKRLDLPERQMMGKKSGIDDDKLRSLWARADSVTVDEVARELGVHYHSVGRRAKKLGLPPKKRMPRGHPAGIKQADHAKFTRMWVGGEKCRVIADRMGVTPTCVSVTAKRLGLDPRAERRPLKPVVIEPTPAVAERSAYEVVAKVTCPPGWTERMLVAVYRTGGRYRELAAFAGTHGMTLQRVTTQWHRVRAV